MNDKQREYHKNYYREYRKKESWKKYKATYNTIRYDRIKTDVFNHYGRECVFCGETRFDKLSIDHPNDDGGEHRRSLGMNCGGINFYIWLIQNDFPPGLQTLCISCNCRKNAVWMWKTGKWSKKTPKRLHVHPDALQVQA